MPGEVEVEKKVEIKKPAPKKKAPVKEPKVEEKKIHIIDQIKNLSIFKNISAIDVITLCDKSSYLFNFNRTFSPVGENFTILEFYNERENMILKVEITGNMNNIVIRSVSTVSSLVK